MASFMDKVKTVCGPLKRSGHDCFLVGGAVRDLLGGFGEPHDIDIATNARPEEVKRAYEREESRVYDTGIAHGTVTVHMNGNEAEVTTYREEGPYSDGRHPDWVKFVDSIDEELGRRDLTINSMAMDPDTGTVIDPFGGQSDLKAGIIKATGNPKDRFMEDGLRPVRACRFASRFGFDIDPDTERAMRDPQVMDRVKMVSPQRFRDELEKALETDKPSVALNCMLRNGQMGIFLREVARLKETEQTPPYHDRDAWEHTVTAVDYIPRGKTDVRMAALVHDIGKPDTAERQPSGRITFYGHEEVGSSMVSALFGPDRLNYSDRDKQYLKTLVRRHMIPHDILDLHDKSIRKFINAVGEENLDDLLLLNEADTFAHACGRRCADEVHERNERLKERVRELGQQTGGKAGFGVKDLKVTGHDVMEELGIGPGKCVGEVLSCLVEAVLESPDKNDHETLRKMMRECQCS